MTLLVHQRQAESSASSIVAPSVALPLDNNYWGISFCRNTYRL